jgi:hypothetical protein
LSVQFIETDCEKNRKKKKCELKRWGEFLQEYIQGILKLDNAPIQIMDKNLVFRFKDVCLEKFS